jgi:hypothetical protein
MLTDRDIVIKGLASGLDPRTATVGELARNGVYYVMLMRASRKCFT